MKSSHHNVTCVSSPSKEAPVASGWEIGWIQRSVSLHAGEEKYVSPLTKIATFLQICAPTK